MRIESLNCWANRTRVCRIRCVFFNSRTGNWLFLVIFGYFWLFWYFGYRMRMGNWTDVMFCSQRLRGGYDADERTRRMRRAVNAHGGGSGGRGFEPGSGRRSSSSSSAGGGHYHYQSRGTGGGGGRGHSSRGGGNNSNNSNNSNRGGGRGSGSRAGGGSRRWDGFGASYGF
jgi:hypothetical protein